MSNLVLPLSGLAVLLSSCALQDFYGREYVLYDRPASAPVAPGVARVFELERQAAELRAAVDAGLDPDGRVAARLAAVEAEREALVETLGDDLLDARRRRIEQILGG